MALLTGKEYVESLKELSPEVYVRGEKVQEIWSHPLLRQTVNHIAAGYDFALDPRYRASAAVQSPLTGEEVPRIQLHIQESLEDVVAKAKLTREITGRRVCAGCMSNMLSVTWALIYDIDQAHSTKYFPRFREFVKSLQKKDQIIAWGMMDPKGDRSLPPSQQKHSPDLRIVKQRSDGILVRGTKVHTTFGPAAHHIVVVPCRALGPEDKEYAVSFALPIDAKGLKMIARPSPGPAAETKMESPLSSRYLGVEAMTLFDDVFVPEDKIFMCREWDQAFKLPLYFASLHRQSKCACSAGHTDLFIGTSALAAEVNGLGMKVSHIRDKITEMMMAAETAFGCSLGAALEGKKHPSGVFLPDPVIANSGLNFIRSRMGTHLSYLHDIAGGLLSTMPTEADWNHPDLRKYIEEGLRGSPKYSTEERLKVMNLAQDLAASRLTGTLMGFTINAAGSPVTNQIVVRNLYDLEKRIQVAKEIVGMK
ncbi:MAG TPA: 4-hydroxyphenylacetate 3-hydroxylase N-terminal domain-containing protein [Thermodesulfobacteriota bacterium]|nr:4-hydroxyphenylacetate 3-hydroxylase N-terminal domain-containing protein [Thermodesulfobacteriota bacterium]